MKINNKMKIIILMKIMICMCNINDIIIILKYYY